MGYSIRSAAWLTYVWIVLPAMGYSNRLADWCINTDRNRGKRNKDDGNGPWILYILLIFSSLLKSGVTLRQKYQFVRPEKNTEFTRGTITLILKEKDFDRSPLKRVRYIEIANFSIAVYLHGAYGYVITRNILFFNPTNLAKSYLLPFRNILYSTLTVL